MAIDDFEGLLTHAIGLDAASIGRSAIERAVGQRQAACRVDSRGAYWDLVRRSKDELQELVEAVVVPETWFFRDREAFAALVRVVFEMRVERRSDAATRILSLPCATGEEPYSIAMALLDAGLSPQQFRVDAVDISHHALAEARAGIYRKSSFRDQALDYRQRYFDETAAGYRITDAVRRQVAFHYGNILNIVNGSLSGAGGYDAIFCRNVLIYFDRPAQERAMATLSQLLAPDGLLFVGPAEAAVVLGHAFTSARIPRAHAFRKNTGANAGRPARPLRARTVPAPKHRPSAPIARSASTVVNERHGAPPTTLQAEPPLEEGMRLANEGRFVEAAACCEAHLRRHGPSAQAFYLLGLVRDAAGQHADATGYYRKTLYLDPRHHEALVHLALLLEAQNNAAEAQLLRSRARRVAQQGGAS